MQTLSLRITTLAILSLAGCSVQENDDEMNASGNNMRMIMVYFDGVEGLCDSGDIDCTNPEGNEKKKPDIRLDFSISKRNTLKTKLLYQKIHGPFHAMKIDYQQLSYRELLMLDAIPATGDLKRISFMLAVKKDASSKFVIQCRVNLDEQLGSLDNFKFVDSYRQYVSCDNSDHSVRAHFTLLSTSIDRGERQLYWIKLKSADLSRSLKGLPPSSLTMRTTLKEQEFPSEVDLPSIYVNPTIEITFDPENLPNPQQHPAIKPWPLLAVELSPSDMKKKAISYNVFKTGTEPADRQCTFQFYYREDTLQIASDNRISDYTSNLDCAGLTDFTLSFEGPY